MNRYAMNTPYILHVKPGKRPWLPAVKMVLSPWVQRYLASESCCLSNIEHARNTSHRFLTILSKKDMPYTKPQDVFQWVGGSKFCFLLGRAIVMAMFFFLVCLSWLDWTNFSGGWFVSPGVFLLKTHRMQWSSQQGAWKPLWPSANSLNGFVF